MGPGRLNNLFTGHRVAVKDGFDGVVDAVIVATGIFALLRVAGAIGAKTDFVLGRQADRF